MMGYVDLHLHLDGSISAAMARKLADMQNIALPETDEALERMLKCPKDCRDLNDYLTCFELPLSLLQTRKGICEAVYRLQEELKAQGLIYAEIRFAPQLHCDRDLSQEEVVAAAVEGLNWSDFPANLILCCMRGEDNLEENIETVWTAKHFRKKGVAGIDLAGAEGLYPTKNFREIFELASTLSVPYTIHAGEADGPRSVKKAMEFGAKRIGHGVRACEDPVLLQDLSDEGIVLELCPKSNLDTRIFPDISAYPLRKFLEYEILVTINTDNMEVSDTTIEKEMERLKQEFSLTEEEILQLELNAVNASFAPEKQKKELRKLLTTK
ncbi:MAG: adenosine deaminase [Hespellia sp.]|nr:adenosine deaminase [Hespellia sp.]